MAETLISLMQVDGFISRRISLSLGPGASHETIWSFTLKCCAETRQLVFYHAHLTQDYCTAPCDSQAKFANDALSVRLRHLLMLWVDSVSED